MRSDPLGVVGVHDGLGSGADGDGTVEDAVAVLGDPSYFWGKSFDVFFFCHEDVFGDEEREVGVLYSDSFDLAVEPVFDVIPD